MDNLKFGWWRQGVGAGVAVFYLATNVVFCHSAEARFWSARREAARKLNKNGGAVASASRSAAPTDALVLAQLPGGVRFDVHSPAPAYVTPVPAKEHLVGGKVPVFSSDLPRWLGEVVTPFGNIRDVHLSKRPGAPLVIHIQDLHDSTEAQRNIAGLVEALQDERGVSLVGLEGAQGAFATEAFRAFPDAEITKAVAAYFMEEGYLGGPEFAGITAKRVPLLWGVEDMVGYNANVTAVKESAQNRPVVELFLREARTLLNEIKTRRLSPALLEFDRNFSSYQSRKLSLGAYVRYLLKSSPSGAARAPNLVLLRDALTWEESLDFPRIERERASLLERMVQALPKQQLKNLVDKSALYRLGRISYGDYYRFFRTLCDENAIPISEYRQLHAYVRYVLLAERINRNDLLNELSAMELSVQDQLVSHPRERRVVNAARHLGQLERLVRHSYTPMDWGYHILHEDEIRNVGLTVRALAKEEGLPETLSPPSVEMLKPFENFCLQALGRNGAMVGNLLEKMAAEKRPSAVLVAGGFHTDGMTQLFRQKDVSYVVVTPKINGDLPEGHRSLDILARDPAPLEKLFAGETVNIPTLRIVNPVNSQNSPFVIWCVNLFAGLALALQVFSTQAPARLEVPLPSVATAYSVLDGETARVTLPHGTLTVTEGRTSLADTVATISGKEYSVQREPEGKVKVLLALALSTIMAGLGWAKQYRKELVAVGLTIISPAAGAATIATAALSPIFPSLVAFILFIVIPSLSWFKNRIVNVDDFKARYLNQGYPAEMVDAVFEFSNQKYAGVANEILDALKGFDDVGLVKKALGMLDQTGREDFQSNGRFLISAALWALRNGKDLEDVPGGLDNYIDRLRQGKPKDAHDQWAKDAATLLEKNKGNLSRVGVANGDMNLISSLNDAYKTMGGLDRPDQPSGDMLLQPNNSAIPPPFREFWNALALIVAQEGGYLYAGAGGDEFRVFIVGENISQRYERIVSRYNQMLAERYDFYTITASQKDEDSLKISLEQSGIPLWLVRNGKGYVVMVDRQFADENYDQTLKEKIKENNNWQIEQRSVSRTGLGPFSISLGGFEIDKLLSLLENRLEVNWLEKPLAMARVADWLANDSLAAAKNLSRNLFRMVQTTSELESNSQNNSLSDKNLRKIYEKPGVYESQSAPWLLPYQQFRDQVNGQKGTMVFGDVTRYYKEKVGKYWWSRLGLVLVDRMLTLLEKYPSVARFVPLHWFRQAEVRAVVRAFHKLKGSDDALGDAVRDAYRKVMLEWMFNNEVSDLSKFTPPAGVLITNFGPDNLLFFIPESASMPQFGEATFTDLTRKFKEALGRISGMGNTMKLLKGTLDPHLSILTVPTEAFESGSKAGDKTPDKRHQELGELIDLEGFFVSSSRMVGSSGANIENMKTVVDADLFEDANVLFLKYSKKTEKLSAFEIKKREMEEAKGMKALGVLRSRVQPFFPSALWNGFTRVVGRYFGEKAGQWAKRTMSGGALFYSVVVPIVELVIFPGFIFFNPLGLSLGVLIPFAALLAALTHGIPYLGRGPPKKWYQQSIDQFVVRLWASLALFTFAAFVGTWGFDLSTLDWKNTALSAYTFHAIYNFFAPEQYRLSVAKGRRATKGETASRPLDPQVIEESAAVEAKLNALLTELQSLGGDRLKTFQEISSLRYRPPARDADDQIQKYLDRILRQMALPEASSTSRHVADPVLFEAVFYDKLTALQKLKEKGQRGNSLDASNRAMVKTAALIFVPLASRLGWNSMADQIADLTFELLEPHRHDPIKKDLLEIPGDVNRNFTSLSKMDDHAHFLQRKITEGIKPLVGEHVEVRVRRKKLYSIAAKIINKPDHYRSAKDLKDVFNAVVVFNKKRNATWATTQGQLYTYIYGILEAKEIEGYIDGRDPKDSFEPKAREDTHVLYLTNRGFVEVQFKSWDVYREYKSKGQVTQRWKKPPHWIHKTKTILKALYEVKSLSLESDTFEITGDVGKNLDGIVRTLLPYEFPAITNSSGTEARVVRISRGSKVIDLVASREAGFELDDVPTVKAQKSGGQGQGPIDRRPMGTESLVSSSDVFFIVNYGNQTAQTLPSSDFSLRARLALLSNDKRQSGLQNANSELRELVPNGVRSPGFIELFFNLLTLSPSRADHRQEMFLSTAKSIATRKGLASTEELYMAWGTGLLSSEELGQAIYEEGKRVLADHRFGLDDPHVVSALQSMVVENQDIIGQVAALPPILGKCSEMLVRPDADQLKNKDLYKLVLGVSLGLISIETVRANFPSVTLAEKTMGQTHTFTISGSDRVGFILQIIRLLNENDAAVESIEAPPAESPGTETSIVVKTKVKEGSLDKLRMALGKIPTAESGPRLNSKARSYRLKILHELDIRPLESALEVLENFEANVTAVPPSGIKERVIDFRMDPRQVAALEKALSTKADELGGDVYFAVEEFKSGPNSTIPLGGLFGLSFIDPSGLSVVSLLGIGVVLGFFYPSLKNLILDGLKKKKHSFGLGRVLVGLSLMLVSGVAFGADGGVALGALDGAGLLLSEEMAGAALGVDPPTMAAVNRLIGGSVFFWLGISTFREQLAGALKKIWDLSIKKGGRLSWQDKVLFHGMVFYPALETRFPLSDSPKTGSLSPDQMDEIFEIGKILVDELFDSLQPNDRLSFEDRMVFYQFLFGKKSEEEEGARFSRYMQREEEYTLSQIAQYFESRAVLREVGLAYLTPTYKANIKGDGSTDEIYGARLQENAPIYEMGESLLAPLNNGSIDAIVREQGKRNVKFALDLLKLRSREKRQWIDLDSIRGVNETFDEHRGMEAMLSFSDAPNIGGFELLQQETIVKIIYQLEKRITGDLPPDVNALRKIERTVGNWEDTEIKTYIVNRLTEAIEIAEIIVDLDTLIALRNNQDPKAKRAYDEAKGRIHFSYSKKTKLLSKSPKDMWILVLLYFIKKTSKPEDLKELKKFAIYLFRYTLRHELPYAPVDGKKEITYVDLLVNEINREFGVDSLGSEFPRQLYAEFLTAVREANTQFIKSLPPPQGSPIRQKQQGLLSGFLFLGGIVIVALAFVFLLPVVPSVYEAIISSTSNLQILESLGGWQTYFQSSSEPLQAIFLAITGVSQSENIVRRILGKEDSLEMKGAPSGIDGAVFGKPLFYKPDKFNGVIYPRYGIPKKEIPGQQARVDEVFESVAIDPSLVPLNLKDQVKERIKVQKMNAQAMLVDVFDLAIAGNEDEGAKLILKSLKIDLIKKLGESHSLSEVSVDDEVGRLKNIAGAIWTHMVGSDRPLEFPNEFVPDGTSNQERLFGLYWQIKDTLFETGPKDVREKKISAVTFLSRKINDFAKQIEKDEIDLLSGTTEEGRDSVEQRIQALRDFSAHLRMTISLLNPDIILGSQRLEKDRFSAALATLQGVSHGRRNVDGNYFSMLQEGVPLLVDEGRSVESAIYLLMENYMADPINKRDTDALKTIRDINEAILEGIRDPHLKLDHPWAGKEAIVIVENPLLPIEISEIEKWGVKIQAIVMFHGSQAMHGPIFAKTSGYLCVVGVGQWGDSAHAGWDSLQKARGVAVFPDGRVVFNPKSEHIEEIKVINRNEEVQKMLRIRVRQTPNGVVELLASPDNHKSAESAKDQGALGVGLYRTDFIYAGAGSAGIPNLKDDNGNLHKEFEDYLVNQWVQTSRLFPNGNFDVRIFDYDPNPEDKLISDLPRSQKRGADYILSDGKQFAQQEIHAVMRAYLKSNNIRLFFPMVNTSDEARLLREMVEDVRNNRVSGLDDFSSDEKEILARMQVGAMVETKSAVQHIEGILQYFDFINIGTKDLTLDIFETKSNSPTASALFEKINKKVIDNIITVIKAAHRLGKPVTACGVLAGNKIFIPLAIVLAKEYGLKLSVPASEVDKWNLLIMNFKGFETELEELKSMIEAGVDNTEQITMKAQGIVNEVEKKIREGEEFKKFYNEMFGKKFAKVENLVGAVIRKIGEGVPEFKITQLGPAAVVNDAGVLEINEEEIQRWGREGGEHPAPYAQTQLHTAILAAMARSQLGTLKQEVVNNIISRYGLTESAVDSMFSQDRAMPEHIQRLQIARYDTLLKTNLVITETFTDDDLMPLAGFFGGLEVEIVEGSMAFDADRTTDINRFVDLTKEFSKGEPGETLSGSTPSSVLDNLSDERSAQGNYRPNGLALALDDLIQRQNTTVQHVRESLAMEILGIIEHPTKVNSLTKEVLPSLWKSFALLVGLNGSLSEKRAVKREKYIHRLRRWFQALDMALFVNLSFIVSHQNEAKRGNGHDLTDEGFAAFNQVMNQAGDLRDVHQALTESFVKGEDILVYVSPNMALKKRNDLTSAEKTQIDMLTLLSKRLVDTEDLEAAAWLAKKKQIVFAVVGTEKQVSKVDNSGSSLMLALMRAGADLTGLNRSADQGRILLGFAKFIPEKTTKIVLAKAEFDKLEIDQVSLFALDVEGVTVDYSGVKDKIVSFILALAGGLMTQVAPGIVESLKKQQAVKRSA